MCASTRNSNGIIVSEMTQLGFTGHEKGFCAGFSNIAVEYFLKNREQQFIEHLAVLVGTQELAKKIIQVQQISDRKLTAEEQYLLKEFDFLKEIVSYQIAIPALQCSIKNVELVCHYQMFYETSCLSDDIARLEVIFQAAQQKKEEDQRVAIILWDESHAIALLYSPKTNTWVYINSQGLQMIPQSSQQEVVSSVTQGLSQRGELPHIRMHLYALPTADSFSFLSEELNAFKSTCRQREAKKMSGVDENGETPAHHCADRGDELGIFYLIENGAELNSLSYKGESPITIAVKKNHWEIVLWILFEGPDNLILTEKDQKLIQHNPHAQCYQLLFTLFNMNNPSLNLAAKLRKISTLLKVSARYLQHVYSKIEARVGQEEEEEAKALSSAPATYSRMFNANSFNQRAAQPAPAAAAARRVSF